MPNCRPTLFRPLFSCGQFLSIQLAGALLLTVAAVTMTGSAAAQAAAPVTFLDRQLERTDLAVSGVGQFTNNTNGTNYLQLQLNLVTSNTLGALATLHYQRSPLIGVEVNFGYVRYTENFTLTSTAASPPNTTSFNLGIQTNADEITVGYKAQIPRQFFGLQPFAGVGAGTIAFKPTSGGGQRLPSQYRAGYYYTIGVDTPLYGPHFGARAQFRQLFFYAPDFLTNYLTDKQRQITSEPSIGIFLRF